MLDKTLARFNESLFFLRVMIRADQGYHRPPPCNSNPHPQKSSPEGTPCHRCARVPLFSCRLFKFWYYITKDRDRERGRKQETQRIHARGSDRGLFKNGRMPSIPFPPRVTQTRRPCQKSNWFIGVAAPVAGRLSIAINTQPACDKCACA